MSILRPVRQHVDHRLRVRLRVFLIVWLLLIGVVGIEVVRQNFDSGLFLVASISGFLVGIFLSRIYRLDWNEETTKVIWQLDLIGRVGATRRSIRLVLHALSVLKSEKDGPG